MKKMEEASDDHHEVLSRLHIYLKQFDTPQFKRFAADTITRQSTEAAETAMAVDSEDPHCIEKRQRHNILQESTNTTHTTGQGTQATLETTAPPQRND